jgi:hypothetical protein
MVSEKVAKTLSRIIECNFVCQIINMIGNFNIYQVTGLTESSNTFIADNLFDKENRYISDDNVFNIENKIKILFIEPDSGDVIKVPRNLLNACFNLMRTPFYLLMAIYRNDKGTAAKSIQNEIKGYEKKVKEAENLAASFLSPRDKLINDIKTIIDSIDPMDISITEIARRYGKARQTFVDKLKSFHIEIDITTGILKDSETGVNL